MNGNAPPVYLLVLPWSISARGGVNEVVISLAQRLRAQGAFYPMIAVASWDYVPQPPEIRGIDLVNIRMRPFCTSGKTIRSFAAFLATLPSDTLQLVALIRARRIEVINAHFPNLNAYVVLIMKRLGLFKGRFLLSFHLSDIAEIGKTRGFRRAAWRYLITSADRAVACSHALACDVLRFAPAARVVTIQNGMDLGLFQCSPRSRLTRRCILHVGRFHFNKAHEILLRAFERLLQAIPDASLVLIGGEDRELPRVRAMISDLGLQRHTELHVNVSHERIPEFMNRADLFVLPSRAEGFPLVLLEAGAAGLPVVATPVGGIPEMIENEITGLMIPPDDPIELEKAMRRLLTDTAAADRLAGAWHVRATSCWSWEKTCREYLGAVNG